MYEVFRVKIGRMQEEGFMVYYCPDAPYSVAKRIPYDGYVYRSKQNAYRRKWRLERKLKTMKEETTV